MKIDYFDTDKEVLIIAEIGNNHEGSYTLAEEMIGLAAEAGAGAVKFQTIIPEKLVSVQQKERIQQLSRFQLSYEEFEKLSNVARQANILFLSTPFDLESVNFLDTIVPAFKIASGDNHFFPLIDAVARTRKPILLSTGLADTSEIIKSRDFIQHIWKENGIEQDLALLHCVASYPTHPEEANLLAIRRLKELGVTAGYSDHVIGNEAAVLSVALGARIIEKHFTIAKDYSAFHDHKLAADPKEFKELVEKVKQVELILGDGELNPRDCEKDKIPALRRSIVAARDLCAGTILSWDDLSWVRPASSLVPGEEKCLLGKTLNRDLVYGDLFSMDDVE